MSQIDVSNLTFYYDGSYENIFENVSFQLDTDWKLGLIGRNGKGKTTFLKLLLGQLEYQGRITRAVPFDYFPYEIADSTQYGIDIIEQMDPEYELWKVLKELSAIDMDPEVLYRPFNTLSNGEQTRLMLAVLFARENHFLLIDEPTNHLDFKAREEVMHYLRKKKGFILVSHDRAFLDDCVDHILAINKTNIDLIQGNFSSWWEQKRRQDEYELTESEKLGKEIHRLEMSARKAGAWASDVEKTKNGTRVAGLRPDRGAIGHKSAKMMKRALHNQKRAETAVDQKKKLLHNIEKAEPLKLFPLTHHKDVLVRLKNVAIRYGDQVVCKEVSFEVHSGSCVVLNGKNGCGKSSVLQLIRGQKITFEGELEIAGGMKISYLPQDTSDLHGDLEEFIQRFSINAQLFKALLRKLDFDRSHFEKPLHCYSEGQKKKVLLARSLCDSAHLYIWDEPLNYIDLFSRMQIEALIKEYKPTLLLVEHDKRFIEELGSEIIYF